MVGKKRKYLILGCNRFQVKRFAKLNELTPSDYICVLSYKQMYGHTNAVLIILDAWSMNMDSTATNNILDRLHWWKKRNSVKYLSEDGLITFTKTILRVIEEQGDEE